jgi:hypothetical protein
MNAFQEVKYKTKFVFVNRKIPHILIEISPTYS